MNMTLIQLVTNLIIDATQINGIDSITVQFALVFIIASSLAAIIPMITHALVESTLYKFGKGKITYRQFDFLTNGLAIISCFILAFASINLHSFLLSPNNILDTIAFSGGYTFLLINSLYLTSIISLYLGTIYLTLPFGVSYCTEIYLNLVPVNFANRYHQFNERWGDILFFSFALFILFYKPVSQPLFLFFYSVCRFLVIS
ncbi:MAG: hypothetical protein COA86_17785 [Kangiella sp.]|nr:MAG: hypothetical protein COA86_17785 [Kangiella sp.]